MPALTPTIPVGGVSALSLLKDARYGFERDDHDGYVFAQRCIAQAIALLEPSRFYTRRETVYDRQSPNGFRIVATCEHPNDAITIAELLNKDAEANDA